MELQRSHSCMQQQQQQQQGCLLLACPAATQAKCRYQAFKVALVDQSSQCHKPRAN
jgi:hypothetical protein